MNKKGFTLIELLAIISILAIILLIAVPTITNVINTASKNAFRNSILAIEKQSTNQIVMNLLENNITVPDVGYYSGFNIKEVNLLSSGNNYKGYFLFVNKENSKTKFDTYIYVSDGKQMVCGVNIQTFTIDDIEIGKECPFYVGEPMVISNGILTPGDMGEVYYLMNYYGDEIVNDYLIDPDIYLSVELPDVVAAPNTVTVTIDYHNAPIKKYKLPDQEIKDYTGPFEVSFNTIIYAQGTNGDLTSEISIKEIANIVPEGLIIVSNSNELDDIRNNLDADYVIINDIDMSGYDFEPISGFNGKIYGTNKVIRNLTINKPLLDGVGFLTDTGSKTELRNLSFENLNLTGNNYVGIIGNSNNKIVISNVHVSSGNIKGVNYVGGIIGNGKISGTYLSNKGLIEGVDYVGGIAGKFLASSILKKSYNDAIIKGVNYVGGISGQQQITTISNVYNLGDIDTNNIKLSGGITGQLYGGNISQSYNTGLYLNNSDPYVDPFVGGIHIGNVTKSSLYNITAINNIANPKYVNIDTIEAATKKETYKNLDFETVFSINENSSLPYIKGLVDIDNHVLR